MSVATAPNKDLVDGLIAQRRERYRCARQDGRHAEYAILPATNTTTLPNTTAAAAAQKQSTAHLLLRMLGLGFIVPLCDPGAAGLPSAVDHDGFSVNEAIGFMSSLLVERPDALEHIFCSRSDDDAVTTASKTPYESTTLLPWLLPRILCAAATLTLRIAARGSDAVITPLRGTLQGLQKELLNLGFLLLDISLKRGTSIRTLSITRATLHECMRASILALASVGKQTFHYASTPSVDMIPVHRPSDVQVTTFFDAEASDAPSKRTQASLLGDARHPITTHGNGISGLWLMEDWAAFSPPWSEIKDRWTIAHALFLQTCKLMLRLEKVHAPLIKDIGDSAATLLHSNWMLSQVSMQPKHFDERLAAFGELSDTASLLMFDRLNAVAHGQQSVSIIFRRCEEKEAARRSKSPSKEVPMRRSVHDLTAMAQRDLISKSRVVRIACGREISTAVERICKEASAANGFDPTVKRFDGLFNTINAIMKSEGQTAKVKETLVLCLAQLGRVDSFDVRQKVLHCLIMQLGADPLTKSLAYTTITQLATQRRCTTFQLLAPHFDVIAPDVVERMAKSPMLFLELLQLTRQSQSKFLLATLQYTLPRIIELEDNNCLNLIAKGIGADVQSMCLNNAPAVLKSLLMLLPPPRRDRCIRTFVEKVQGGEAGGAATVPSSASVAGLDGGGGGITLKSLLRVYSVELLGHLVIRLGDSATIQRKRAHEGLLCMDNVLNDRQRRTIQSASSRDVTLGKYLKDEILAILSWLNEELMNVHGKRSMAHKSVVTRSIGAMIDLIGEPISNVTPQLMATLNTTMQVRELILPTLESLYTFVLRARSENVGPFIGQAAAALLASWSKFGQSEKLVANNILTYVIVDSYDQFQAYLSGDEFPDLSEVKDDIPEVWSKLTVLQRRSPVRVDHRLMHIIDRAANDNTSVCKQALLELRSFLCTNQKYLESATSGNAFNEVVGRMMRCLLDTAARSGEDEEGIRDLSLEILGVIGAVDPDRLPYASSEQAKVPLNDFNDKEELTTFAVHLISDVLVGAYKATHDTKHQAALAYAIQELLKFCGFTSALLPARDSSAGGHRGGGGGGGGGATVGLKTRQRWNTLVKYVDTLAPLLESKYAVNHKKEGASSSTPTPFYAHTPSFKEWVQTWTNTLIVEINGEHAGIVFDVFRSVIKDHDLSIAQYILPHLVLNAVTMGNEEQQARICEEIQYVLQDQVTTTPRVASSERRLLSAQVVFGLLDHLSVWQRARQREKVRREGRQEKPHKANKRDVAETATVSVERLISFIGQDLMADASLRCRAYARSLLNHEHEIRVLQQAEKDALAKGLLLDYSQDELQPRYEDVHLIYANLDEPDGMEGVSSLVLQPSLEHQIREHESTGRWTSAQSCWEVKIQESPNELDLHVGLLRCLRNLGHYDTMRTHIRGVLAEHEDWAKFLAPFYVEGCCILSDWKEVRRTLKAGEANASPQHAMAAVMLAMHDHDAAAFNVSLKDARRLLGKPLVVGVRNNGTRNSSDYIAVYDTVAQLHMLHELGMIAGALGLSSEARVSANELKRSFALRLDSTLPSFRTREPLLSMRRSALSTQKNDRHLREIAGQCWIASSKIARRERHLQTAYSAALQASQCKVSLAFVQHAKLLAIADQDQAALQEMVNSLPTVKKDDFKTDNPADMHSYANAHLFAARLSDASGRRQPNEIVEMYKRCAELDGFSEKMWYHLGRYYDQLQERDTTAVRMIHLANPLAQHFNTCRYFLRSALHGTKYFYRTIPRVLTIWLTISDEDGIVNEVRRSKSNSSKATRSVDEQMDFFNRINELLTRAIEKLAPFQWLAVFPQLLSRVAHRNDKVWSVLQDLISHVLTTYPDQAMWSMVAGLQSTDKQRKERFESIVSRVKASAATLHKSKVGVHIVRTTEQMIKMAKELLYLCDYQVKDDKEQLEMKTSFPNLLELARKGDLILPVQSSLSVSMPSTSTAQSTYAPFSDNLPRIIDLDNTIKIMSSLQRPRKIIIKASDGRAYAFLCKPKDDLRKDARLMEFDGMINNLLQSNPESRKRRLYIRTYAVVTLNEECGLIEWVPNTIGFRFILQRLYDARGIQLYSNAIKADMEAARNDPKKAAGLFESKILGRYPPLFHEWFITTFPEPSAWLAARLNYGRTLAVMSMVGYVLGLGDRHGENILFDAMSGDTVHVDLNCLFERGATFDIPERVPFRLTQNLVDALGVTGVEGVFRKAAEISMNTLRENRDSLMSVLEAMVHDPLVEWGMDTRNAKARTSTTMRAVDPRVIEARKSLDPIRNKLLGQLRRTTASGATAGVVEPGSLLSGGWTSSHSTNSLVDALIRDATSSLLLSQMYIGWTPYL